MVEWKQHEKKSGVFFHEEGVFSLWTMKVIFCLLVCLLVFFCMFVWLSDCLFLVFFLSCFAKVMDVNPTKHLVFFLCIDYTIWPGNNFVIYSYFLLHLASQANFYFFLFTMWSCNHYIFKTRFMIYSYFQKHLARQSKMYYFI